MSLLEIEMPIS